MTSSGATVSVVMVSYHTGPVLTVAIEAVLGQAALKELILVDNGNDPLTLELLQGWAKREPKLTVLTGHGNVGFAAGCNLGVAQASGKYLLLLNPDGLLPEDALVQAIEDLDGFASARLLGAKIIGPGGREQRGSRRNLMTPFNAIGEMLGLWRFSPRYRLNLLHAPPPPVADEVPAVSGAFLFCKTAFFREMNGLDAEFFLHVEDMDFCFRVREAGHAVIWSPRIEVVHFRSTSAASTAFVERHKARGFLLYFRKHFALNPILDGTLLFVVGTLYLLRVLDAALFGDAEGERRTWRAQKRVAFAACTVAAKGLAGRTVAVTGARGLVGACLIGRLRFDGARVIAVSRRRVRWWLPRLQWVRMDLDAPYVAPLVGAEALIHCAPLWTLPPLLEKLLLAGAVKRVVAFGSTSVMTKRDSADPYERQVAQRLVDAEESVKRLCDAAKVPWTILRPTMIYGAGLDGNVAVIERQLKRWGMFPLYGGGEGLRQPVHFTDLADAAATVLDTPASHGKTYNLSGGETLSYRTMVWRIARKAKRGRPVPAPFLPLVLWFMNRVLGCKHLNPAMAYRMNEDLVFDHADATRDFEYTPRRFLE